MRADSADPFRDCDPIHENGLARLAAEAGDAQLDRVLAPESTRERRLLALRAAPFASAPERLIPALVQIAVGRDPVLAPEAGLALSAIGNGLRPSEMAAREVLLAELARAYEAAAAGRAEKAVRADIALALASVADQLETARRAAGGQ